MRNAKYNGINFILFVMNFDHKVDYFIAHLGPNYIYTNNVSITGVKYYDL